MSSLEHARSADQQRYLALDGWRGICALIVAVLHFYTTGIFTNLPVVTNGYLFVDFFFLLSGFVLSHAYLNRLNSIADVGWMVWRRLGRLWPLHMALLIALIALELAGPLAEWLTGVKRSAESLFDPASSNLLEAVPTNILLVQGLGIHDRLTWNEPSWSISVEFWTYAVFAIVVLSGPARTMMSSVILMGLGSIILAYYSPHFLDVDNGLGFFRCIAGFFAGHIVFRLLSFTPKRLPYATLIEASIAAGVFLFVAYAGGGPFELAAPLVFGVTVWFFAQEKGAVSQLLKSAPLQSLGLWSYSIYMVHTLIIVVLHRGITIVEKTAGAELTADVLTKNGVQHTLSFGSPLLMDGLTLIYVLVVVAVSALTWRWIEMPCGRYWNTTLWNSVQTAIFATTRRDSTSHRHHAVR